MALATTTLSSAVAETDKFIVVASATSVAAGRLVRVDDEFMQVDQSYSLGTTVPVLRGREGTAQRSHLASVTVVHGLASDFSTPGAQADVTLNYQRVIRVTSYSATATVTLPKAGEDLRIILYGSAIALTVPVPTRDLDGCMMTFISNAASAHTVTFTGGLGGNTTNSDVETFHASQSQSFTVFAAGGLWTLNGSVAGAATVAGVGLA